MTTGRLHARMKRAAESMCCVMHVEIAFSMPFCSILGILVVCDLLLK